MTKVKGDQTDKDTRESITFAENGKYDEAIDLLFHHKKQSPADPIKALISLLHFER